MTVVGFGKEWTLLWDSSRQPIPWHTHTAYFSSIKRKEACTFFLGENELFTSLLLIVFVIAFVVMCSCVKT